MEEKVNEMADTLMKEAYNKIMLFKMFEEGDGGMCSITASPAALKIFAAELIKASEEELNSELQISLCKYMGDQIYPSFISIAVAEQEKPVAEVKDGIFDFVGCATILLLVALIFISGLIKIYEMIF